MTSPDAEAYNLAEVMRQYGDRNETTDYVVRSAVWQGDRASGQPFTLDMRVKYGAQRVCYRPGFWQEVKFGWVQYLAFLIPLIYWFELMRQYVFTNQIIETMVLPPRDLRDKLKAT